MSKASVEGLVSQVSLWTFINILHSLVLGNIDDVSHGISAIAGKIKLIYIHSLQLPANTLKLPLRTFSEVFIVDSGLLLIPCPLYCLCLVPYPSAQRCCFLIDPVSQAPRTQYSLSPREPASTEPNPREQKGLLVPTRAMNTGHGARNVTHTVPLKPTRHQGALLRTLRLREGK